MKVILQETVEGLGHLGDLLDVSNGYARNYLLPRKKALEANNRNIKALEHVKRVTSERAKKERNEFEDLAKKISAVSLSFSVKVGKDDKMFGSVTSKDIGEGLAEKGFTIDKRKILLDQPIKELGTVTVPIKVYKDVTAAVPIHVIKIEEPAKEVEPTEASTEASPEEGTSE